MDPFVALLLLPPVACVSFFGMRSGFRLIEGIVSQRHEMARLAKECEANATNASITIAALMKAKTEIEAKTQRIEQAHIRADEAHDRLNDLERHVASLKSQLSLSSTARR